MRFFIVVFVSFVSIVWACNVRAATWIGKPSQRTDRVISLAPSLTEIIFAVGEEHKLVGVTRFDDYPPAVQHIPTVGGFVDVDVERVLAAKPDFILAVTDSIPIRVLEQLATRGIPTRLLSATTIDDLWLAFDEIGHLFHSTQAAVLKADLQKRYQALHRICKPERLGIVISQSPWIVVGRASFLHQSLTHVGFVSAIDSALAYATVDQEILRASRAHRWLDLSHDGITPNPRMTHVWRPVSVDPWVRLGPRLIPSLEYFAQQLGCKP